MSFTVCIQSIFWRPGFLFPFGGSHFTAAFVIDSWCILKTCPVHLILLSLMMFSIFSCWVRCLFFSFEILSFHETCRILQSHRWCAIAIGEHYLAIFENNCNPICVFSYWTNKGAFGICSTQTAGFIWKRRSRKKYLHRTVSLWHSSRWDKTGLLVVTVM